MQNYYRRNPNNPFSGLFSGSVVNTLIIINVFVFILQIILNRTPFQVLFALTPRLVVRYGFVWQLVTYMFLHGDLWHIFFNMFALWMFGTTLEHIWGPRRFLLYYFTCGIGGAILSFLVSFNTPTIGASGGIYGLLMAYAILFPHNQIYLMGIFPIRARTLAIALVVIEFFSGILGRSGIAHFAHLGGMAAGLIFLKSDHRSSRFWDTFSGFWKKIPIRISFEREESESSDENKIDSILDKISEKGYENLSETEKRILEKYSDDSRGDGTDN